MSKYLGSVAAKLYDSAVKNAYADTMKLKKTVYVKTTKKADNIKFRKMGKGLATEAIAPSADVIPMNITHELVDCDITRWRAAEYTDIFDAAEVNFSEVNELGSIIADSLGRRSDQLILDALDSATNTVGATGTAITTDTILAAKKELDKNSVPSSDRFFVIESKGMEDLLKTTEITSTDYNSVKALVGGDVDTFLGFKFIQLGDREEGGIPDDGTDFTGYAYHRRSVGMGVNVDIKTSTDWISQKQSWLSVANMSCGSVLIDQEGVVKVTYAV